MLLSLYFVFPFFPGFILVNGKLKQRLGKFIKNISVVYQCQRPDVHVQVRPWSRICLVAGEPNGSGHFEESSVTYGIIISTTVSCHVLELKFVIGN